MFAVDPDTKQMLTVPEALGDALKVLVRASSELGLNALLQALGQHFDAFLQILLQLALLRLHLVIRRQERNQRKNQHQWKNQSKVQAHAYLQFRVSSFKRSVGRAFSHGHSLKAVKKPSKPLCFPRG